MYRFLLTPPWLARLAAVLALGVVMSLLGNWQLNRYEQRAAINERIDAAEVSEPVPLDQVLSAPDPGQAVGASPSPEQVWTRARVTGRYDPAHQLLVRGRTHSGQVGLELVTPLVLPGGAAVLVDRGWVPASGAGAAVVPDLPAVPAGEVTVVGWVRRGESDGRLEHRDGAWHTRRIDLAGLADHAPYPLYGGYLLLEQQTPPAAAELTPVPVRRQNAVLNAAYAAQWWIFTGLLLGGFGWLVRREAHATAAPSRRRPVGANVTP